MGTLVSYDVTHNERTRTTVKPVRESADAPTDTNELLSPPLYQASQETGSGILGSSAIVPRLAKWPHFPVVRQV